MTINPKSAIDALLDAGRCQDDSTLGIYPLTIARYALLDLAESPFVHKRDFQFDSVIVSLYIMCQPAAQLAKYSSKNIDALKADAFEWSEDISPEKFAKYLQKLTDNVKQLQMLMPEQTDNGKKKASS